MPRVRYRLTPLAVKAIQPSDKVTRHWDGDGLYFEVLPAGPRRWMFKYAFNGRERRMSLGPYPAVSLKEARLLRDDARQKIRQGMDPLAERQTLKRERLFTTSATVQTVAEEWIAKQANWTDGYRQDVRRAFEQHVYGPIGHQPIRDITPAILERQVIGPLVGMGRLETARRVRQRLELVWNHALLTERATFNAALPLKGTIDAPAVTNFASASEKELPALLVAVRGYGNRLVEHAVLLQLLTATRPGETRRARWEEFDLERGLWTIPGARMKRGDDRGDHLVPLSTQAVQVLRSLQALTGHAPVLFPSRSRWDVPMSEGAVLMAFRRSGFGHVTAHGMRSLFSTICHEHGRESHVIELCLAHVDKNTVRATYNKALYLPQRRELLQWWGDYVQELCEVDARRTGTSAILPLAVDISSA